MGASVTMRVTATKYATLCAPKTWGLRDVGAILRNSRRTGGPAYDLYTVTVRNLKKTIINFSVTRDVILTA